jgi:hypothetical protein
VPVLPGIRTADVFAVFLQVRQDADLGIVARPVAAAGRTGPDLAEALGKPLQRRRVEMLVGKAQHAVIAEAEQDAAEILRADILRQIEAAHARAQHGAGRFDRQHRMSPRLDTRLAAATGDRLGNVAGFIKLSAGRPQHELSRRDRRVCPRHALPRRFLRRPHRWPINILCPKVFEESAHRKEFIHHAGRLGINLIL